MTCYVSSGMLNPTHSLTGMKLTANSSVFCIYFMIELFFVDI